MGLWGTTWRAYNKSVDWDRTIKTRMPISWSKRPARQEFLYVQIYNNRTRSRGSLSASDSRQNEKFSKIILEECKKEKKVEKGSKWSLIHPLHNGQSDNERVPRPDTFFCFSVGSIIYADLTTEEGGKGKKNPKHFLLKNITRRGRVVYVCNHSCAQTSVASAPSKLTAGESCAHTAASPNVSMIAFWFFFFFFF